MQRRPLYLDHRTSKVSLRFRPTLERSNNKLWSVRVPNSITNRMIESLSGVCSLNDFTEFPCAIVYCAKRVRVITVNNQLRDKRGLECGMDVEVKPTKDESEFEPPMAKEFREVLRQDAVARKVVHALTCGKQWSFLSILNVVKNPKQRIAQALAFVKHPKNDKGIINQKELPAMLRDCSPR